MTNDLAIRILTGDVLGTTEQTHEAVAMAVKALSAFPLSDTVEIVRCKDCIWRDGIICRNNDTMPWNDNDFCSYAERRTDGRFN